MFHPTFVDIGVFIGTIGIFFTLFLLFARVFPVIAQAETKSILKDAGSQYYGANATSPPAKELVEEKEEDSGADAVDEGEDEEDSGENKTEDE